MALRNFAGTSWTKTVFVFAFLLLLGAALGAQEANRRPIAFETPSASDLAFLANVDSERWQLTIVGEGVVVSTTSDLDPPTVPLEDAGGNTLPDGDYQFELRAVSKDEGSEGAGSDAKLPLSGSFRILGGSRVLTPHVGGPALDGSSNNVPTSDPGYDEPPSGLQTKTSADTVLEAGSACIGPNCPAGTGGPYPALSAWLKLQGLGTGIVFADHNSAAGTCNQRGCRDWQIVVNEFFNLGEYFAIADLGTDGGINGGADGVGDANVASVPFRIDGAAPTDSIRVLGSSGNVGMGTAAPAEELEIFSADPVIRLTDSAGTEWNLNNNVQSQEFDIVSTQSGASPVRHFYVQRTAPADQLMLTQAGIGVGTDSPNATLEIEGSSGTSQLAIDEQGADANVEIMFNLICNCAPAFRMTNTVNGQIWFFRHTSAGDFSFDDPNSAGQEARLDSNGNFFIQGSLSQGSSRALKENLEPADGASVLDTLTKLDLYEWSYIDEPSRHFGPMAEEFSAAYGLGASESKISPSDMAGLALAASKTLAEKNEALEAENKLLKQQMGSILERLEALEDQQ